MYKILFVCHGNICRSPMAEFIFKKLISDKKIKDKFFVDSCATSTEELGNPLYPPAKAELIKHGIPFEKKYAKQITKDDYNRFDLIIVMDERNIRVMHSVIGEDKDKKVHKLMEYTGEDRDVADPYYFGNFDVTYNDIYNGCVSLLKTLDI